ncbi:hypothetical protein K457DRAFT_890292 [Linnemannia elongata AG-77]|uniref:F-box domain-containing protein n=1 Tax=Linnemannia elongata AG-77 TaxID=1314771 RepID=A0A197K3B7_9FUNG|nr:hypothetical protein K457DRAFT_890292 [Linnemannia elongata AG-77]
MLSLVSPSSASFGPGGLPDNGEMDTVTSQSEQDEYQQIYNRDEEIYGDCAYDSHDYGDYESEDDYTIDTEKEYWHDVRFIPISSRGTNSSTLTNWPFKPILIRKRRPIDPKVIQPLLDSPEISEIPFEVLELVCGHLSQTTLRSVNRVCKAWYKISERFIHHTGIWKPVDGALQVLVDRWSKLDTLNVYLSEDPQFRAQSIKISDQEYYWAAFAAAITGSTTSDQDAQDDEDAQNDDANADNNNNNNNNNNNDNRSNNNIHDDGEANAELSLPLHRSIRNLELAGRQLSYDDHVSIFRGHLGFIQSLMITATKRDDPIPLFTLLADFPALKSFTYTNRSKNFTDLCHGDDQDSIDMPADLIDPSKNFTEEYRLERFCLSNIAVDRRILERLIVTCPDLRVFNVKELNIVLSNQDDDFSEEGNAIREAEECNARQRLVDLAAKHCPKMEWYGFHRFECNTNEQHLEMVASKFQNQKMHSMIFDSYSEMLDPSAIRNQLSKMTVLQIQTGIWANSTSDMLNKVLCMTPKLLHLIASDVNFDTKSLWQPPAPVQPKHPFTTLGDLKRRERKEQRRARQLARYTRRHYTPPATETPTVDPSIPVTWQVYNLKSLELKLSGEDALVDFTGYINRHRLFRNLTMLNLQIPSLKIGQRMVFPNTRGGALAAAAAATAAAASLGIEPQLGQPVRYPNELLALRSLRCLEECTLRVSIIPGTVAPRNLWFMKRKEDFQSVSFFPTRNRKKRRMTKKAKHGSPKAKRTMTTTTATATSVPEKVVDQANGEEEDEDEKERENCEEEKRWKDETFWPVLNVFHIYYIAKSPTTITSNLTETFEWLRPGVEFVLQGRTSLENINSYL